MRTYAHRILSFILFCLLLVAFFLFKKKKNIARISLFLHSVSTRSIYSTFIVCMVLQRKSIQIILAYEIIIHVFFIGNYFGFNVLKLRFKLFNNCCVHFDTFSIVILLYFDVVVFFQPMILDHACVYVFYF